MGIEFNVYFYGTSSIYKNTYLELIQKYSCLNKYDVFLQFNEGYEDLSFTELGLDRLVEELDKYFSRDDRFSITVYPYRNNNSSKAFRLGFSLLEDSNYILSIYSYSGDFEDEESWQEFLNICADIFKVLNADKAVLFDENINQAGNKPLLEILENNEMTEKEENSYQKYNLTIVERSLDHLKPNQKKNN